MRKLLSLLVAAGLSMGAGMAVGGETFKEQQARKNKEATQQIPSGTQEQEKVKSGKPEQSEATKAKTGRTDEGQPKKFEQGKPGQSEAPNPPRKPGDKS